ncbi:PAS domain S-box-containing protein [Thermonema lapsum]|uniref:PAS domain S-box-containing protein n=1 Tax=Thermonema lapsum TaxID=28195 RepID=A0A846MNP4_9BACT|nr:PAS domain-containing protein [Thermonema lapsum]NIK73075.1 PAS domain S-box-containing protein [Thermonema lapsum]
MLAPIQSILLKIVTLACLLGSIAWAVYFNESRLAVAIAIALFAFGGSFMLDQALLHRMKRKILLTPSPLVPALLQLFDTPALLLDKDQKVVAVNNNFRVWAGLPKQKAVEGQLLWCFLPDHALALWKKGLQEAMEGKSFQSEPSENSDELNQLVWFFTPIQLGDNRTYIAVHSRRPAVNALLRELKEQNEKLQSKIKDLEKTQSELLLAKDELWEQQANIQALIDNAHDFIFSIDFRYKLISYNKAFHDYIRQQYGVELSTHSSLLKQLPPEFISFWRPYIDKVLNDSCHLNIEYDLLQNNKFYEIAFNPIINKEQVTIGVAVFARDITERKKQEIQQAQMLQELEEQAQKLREKEEELQSHIQELQQTHRQLIETNRQLSEEEAYVRAVIDNVQEGIVVIDHDINITLFNRAARQFFLSAGLAVHEGMYFLSLVPEEQLNHWRRLCEKVLQGQSTQTLEYFHENMHEVLFSPIHYHNEIIGACLLIKGISTQLSELLPDEAEMLERIQKQNKEVAGDENPLNKELKNYKEKIESLKKQAKRD